MVFVTLVALSSCATKSVNESVVGSFYSEGVWSGKALITEKKNGKTHKLDVDIVAERPGRLLIDVTSTLGIHVARFGMSDSKVNYILTRRKEYYRGAAAPGVMRSVFSFNVDPRVIAGALFDDIPAGRDWKCEVSDGLPQKCTQTGGATLVWVSRAGAIREMSIAASEGELNLKLDSYKAKVEPEMKKFQFDAPKGFRIIDLNSGG